MPYTASSFSITTSEFGDGLTDIPGIKVGHYTDPRRPTGCTVILVEEGATAGVDVRGGAPGTRETDLLQPLMTVQKIHAVVLAGGSAFGLEAASGVVQFLEEKGIGFDTSVARVPIVPAAIIYDLGLGDAAIRPDRMAGYRACRRATSGRIAEGGVGAGAGATVGKLFGFRSAMKSGLGTAGIRIGELLVASLVVVNAVGDVIDPDNGTILAGAFDAERRQFLDLRRRLREKIMTRKISPGENTSLAVVATNASFDKSGMTKIAQMSHDGFARAINPVHMPMDGDTVFALTTDVLTDVDLGQVGALAADVTARAIVRAVLRAEGVLGIPAHQEIRSSSH